MLFERKKDERGAEQKKIIAERKFLLSNGSDFFIREAYKTLRTNVNFSLAGVEGCKIIAITSSMQSEGKSITAVNLALSLVGADKKVLLIDCDLRKPKIGRLLSMSAQSGLTNVLVDRDQLKASIHTFDDTGLQVLLSGSIPPNPSELLSSARMHELIGMMREKFDYIILDTPPINMVTDAVVLGSIVDGYLFVVRAKESERGAVLHAIDQLGYSQAKILGFVLNGVALEKTSYGYSKHHYRRYSYGRYRRYHSHYGYDGKGYGYGGYGYGGYGYGGYGYGYGYGSQPQQQPPQRAPENEAEKATEKK